MVLRGGGRHVVDDGSHVAEDGGVEQRGDDHHAEAEDLGKSISICGQIGGIWEVDIQATFSMSVSAATLPNPMEVRHVMVKYSPVESKCRHLATNLCIVRGRLLNLRDKSDEFYGCAPPKQTKIPQKLQ